jgi:hypothetical protein
MRPVGSLEDGTPYFAPLGELPYDPDDDRVQCHLCGRWYRIIGSSHLYRVHGWTLDDYRDAFHLPMGTATVSRGVSASLAAEARRRRDAGELRAGWSPDMSAGAAAVDRYWVPRWRSLAALRPELAAELHPTRNGDLDPYRVAPMSRRSVWWRCGSCGHEWRTLLGTRARGYGCPECQRLASIGRRMPVARERSLAVLRPELAAELHPTRNGDLDASTVARWSVQPVWWRCSDCGHEWRVTPQNRAGCPRCSARRPVARERSLAVLRPELAAELHPTRNGDLDPYSLGASADRKVWWQCRYCGREWQARVAGRLHSPGGCPSCAKRRAAMRRWRGRAAEPTTPATD